MSAWEHSCRECDHFWVSADQFDSCPECGSGDVHDYWDESPTDHVEVDQ